MSTKNLQAASAYVGWIDRAALAHYVQLHVLGLAHFDALFRVGKINLCPYVYTTDTTFIR